MPKEDSDQPGQMPNLIRNLAVCLKGSQVTGKTRIRLGKCPGSSMSLHSVRWILLS